MVTSTRGSPSARVSIREGEIVIDTYGWEAALVPTAPEDPIYPYPRLDREQIAPPTPQVYRTLLLENDLLRLTFLPELGGRLYSWLDKPSGQEMLYLNPVIKPTHWGARGWWLGAGGMEWAFPVEEHGYLEWRPWSYRTASGDIWASVTFADRDDRTGLAVEVTVVLEAGRSYFTLRPQISNPTQSARTYQFWLNGMFALSPENRPSPDLRFILPVDRVTVHSTSDGGLPAPGTEIDWPLYEGRYLARYGNWEGWLGVFADPVGYMGAYDPSSGLGVARVYPPDIARGTKVFGPGTIDPGTWTDDGSGYVELWGGLTPTFWDQATLTPGTSVAWQERWYSVNGLGGLSYANDDAALWLAVEADSTSAGALSTRPLDARLVLQHDGAVVATWERYLSAGTPLRVTYPAGTRGTWRIELYDRAERAVASYSIDGH
jgi:hypothetical protein